MNSALNKQTPGLGGNFAGAEPTVAEMIEESKRFGQHWAMTSNQTKVMSTKLAFGLLHQPKWIPLRYAPLTLELELVNSFTDVIIDPDGTRFTRTAGVDATETSIT